MIFNLKTNDSVTPINVSKRAFVSFTTKDISPKTYRVTVAQAGAPVFDTGVLPFGAVKTQLKFDLKPVTRYDWKVTVADTGLNTMTGGRLKRIKRYLGDEPFLMTYGDGVSDVDIEALIKFHKEHGKLATMTVVNAGQRFGVIKMAKDSATISSFREKKDSDGNPINGGFMVLDPKVLDYIDGDSTVFEKSPLESLAKDGELMGYKHDGFWQCMDMKKDKDNLEEMWLSGEAPWKRWED